MSKPAGKRRLGRELGMQLVFMLDHNKTPLDEILPGFFAFKKDNDEPLVVDEKPRKFAEELARGVVKHWAEIDERIKESTANFNLNRVGAVERAILRMAIYEMVYSFDVPPVVAINEAVDIAKKFAADEAAGFINGVLDKVRSSLKRPARTAATPLARMEEQMAQVAKENEPGGQLTPPAEGESNPS
jgi:N utilization substance protein B